MAYSTKPKMWFWIVTIIFLLWNIMGLGAWSTDVMGDNEAIMDIYTVEQIEFFNNFPSWYIWAYGVAVFTGLFTCIALIFKRKQAVLFSLISLIAVIVCRAYEITVDAWSITTTIDRVFLVLVPLFSILLYLFTNNVRGKGWLK